MHAVGLPVPAVLQYHEWKGREYLLLTAVPGQDASAPRPADNMGDHRGARGGHADAPRDEHQRLPVRSFDRVRLAEAEARVRAGASGGDDFDDARQGRSAKDLYAELDRVSGDHRKTGCSRTATTACLTCYWSPMALAVHVSGFVDCGNAGHRRSLPGSRALRAERRATISGRSGFRPCSPATGWNTSMRRRSRYYQLLDEFF